MLAVQEPVPGFLGADAGVPLGGERASGHPAGRPGLLLPQERGAPLTRRAALAAHPPARNRDRVLFPAGAARPDESCFVSE